jgi:hypothetical protein
MAGVSPVPIGDFALAGLRRSGPDSSHPFAFSRAATTFFLSRITFIRSVSGKHAEQSPAGCVNSSKTSRTERIIARDAIRQTLHRRLEVGPGVRRRVRSQALVKLRERPAGSQPHHRRSDLVECITLAHEP